MNKIKPYYFRLSRAYFRKLQEEKIREFNKQLEGATLQQQFAVLTEAIAQQKNLWKQREYQRHQLTFYIDLDYLPHDGYPRVTSWPSSCRNLILPISLKFVCIKNGTKHHIGTTELSYVRRSSRW